MENTVKINQLFNIINKVNYEVIGFDLKGSFYKLNIHFFQLFVIYLL